MSDDFCLLHGYEHMRSDRGPIPYCARCDAIVSDPIRAEMAALADLDDFQLAFRDVWLMPYVVVPTPAYEIE